MAEKKVLILTLLSVGGVATMTRLIVDYLLECGYEADLAYYMPYRIEPEFSVPSWRLLDKKPKVRESITSANIKTYEVGVRMPELEWARYTLAGPWKEIIKKYKYHIVVSGSILPSLLIILQRKPCLAWIATPYLQDRLSRIKTFSWHRKIIDLIFDMPLCCFLEKYLLKKVAVLALSNYTESALRNRYSKANITYMPMPIDTEIFSPLDDKKGIEGKIGFSGRLDDPRKNVKMLIDAIKICREKGFDLTLHLTGANKKKHEFEQYAERLNIGEYVQVKKLLERQKLIEFYRSLDVFVIPSHQEGLGITGLEAMACGCPVVSTRCGGPEEYVKEGVNGFLVHFSAEEIAQAICDIISDKTLYLNMRRSALQTVTENYTDEHVRRIFWDAFKRTFEEVKEVSPVRPQNEAKSRSNGVST